MLIVFCLKLYRWGDLGPHLVSYDAKLNACACQCGLNTFLNTYTLEKIIYINKK